MGQPVKVSDALVLDARRTGELAERSIAGQIEYWATLGRAIEPLLRGDQAIALRQSGGIKPLSQLIAEVDSPIGRQRLKAVLDSRPFPHFERSKTKGLLIKVDVDGTRTLGRFVGRTFTPAKKQR